MSSLIELVKKYQGTTILHKRMEAAEAIIEIVGPPLLAYLRKCCPADVAEDVWQDTLVAIAKNLHTSDGDTERKFRSWCYRIAHNKMVDRLRQEGRKPTIAMSPEDLEALARRTLQDEGSSAEDRLDLEYAMQLLLQAKAPCCLYLFLYYIVGWSYDLIAAVLEKSYDAVRMEVGRCLKLAQKLVEEGA